MNYKDILFFWLIVMCIMGLLVSCSTDITQHIDRYEVKSELIDRMKIEYDLALPMWKVYNDLYIGDKEIIVQEKTRYGNIVQIQAVTINWDKETLSKFIADYIAIYNY